MAFFTDTALSASDEPSNPLTVFCGRCRRPVRCQLSRLFRFKSTSILKHKIIYKKHRCMSELFISRCLAEPLTVLCWTLVRIQCCRGMNNIPHLYKWQVFYIRILWTLRTFRTSAHLFPCKKIRLFAGPFLTFPTHGRYWNFSLRFTNNILSKQKITKYDILWKIKTFMQHVFTKKM
jgi:hypothetical protein